MDREQYREAVVSEVMRQVGDEAGWSRDDASWCVGSVDTEHDENVPVNIAAARCLRDASRED